MGRGLSPEQAKALHAIGAPGPAVPVRLLLAAVYPEAAAAGGADHARALAALDRSLRRLEARGLVVRFSRRAGNAAVAATAEGVWQGRRFPNPWKWQDVMTEEPTFTRHRLARLQRRRQREEAAATAYEQLMAYRWTERADDGEGWADEDQGWMARPAWPDPLDGCHTAP